MTDVDPRKFTKYAVYYGPDAPREAKDEYIKWLRERHRYESGRRRSFKTIVNMFDK